MENKHKVDGLFKEKAKITKEIDEIQKSCPHSEKTLKSIPERVDSPAVVVRWVCNACGCVVGIPKPSDIEEYLKE
jgi:hypothetical protein